MIGLKRFRSAAAQLLFLTLGASACSSAGDSAATAEHSSTSGVAATAGTSAASDTTSAAAGTSTVGASAAGTGAGTKPNQASPAQPASAGASGTGSPIQPSASAATSGSAGSSAQTAGAPASTIPTQASAGSAAQAGASAPSQSTAATSCSGSNLTPPNPFACKFAWGTNDPGGSLSAFAGLSFMSKWVGYEIDMSGNLSSCDGCSWLREQVASTQLVPVYYAYMIGYFGKANGLPDGNENPNGPNLTTDAAKLIRAKKPQLISLYREYAKQSAQAWPDKPIVWLLEGDFVQYTGDSQKEPLTLDELAALGQDISCAIKSEMPNALVAINHSTWNSNEVTNTFWNAMSKVSYDLVWTTGVANNNGFFEKDADASKYNADTATYAYVHKLTGRGIFVDTSFGISEMADSWSGSDVATLNARIDQGVIAANVTKPPDGYVSKAMMLQAQLKPVCQ